MADSLVVHLEDTEDARRELLLFVAPAEGRQVDDGLPATIATAFRSELSPRPDVLNAYMHYASHRSTVR